MKNYLSFGGGINSVAMYLHLIDQGTDFEAIFVDHGADWPETYKYFKMFQDWIIKKGLPKVIVLKPQVRTIDKKIFSDLIEYYLEKRTFPMRMTRSCTDRFKISVVGKYVKKPCFMMIGFALEESHRASINHNKQIENRFPLLEAEIDREGCKKIIKKHGLSIPPKSGCYVCPFQPMGGYRRLRKEHPDLFCKVEKMENQYIARRKKEGKEPLYILKDRPLKYAIEENQRQIFKEDEYPPCQCGL